MPDKEKERWYLARLKACLPAFPLGHQQDGESPDFIIGSEDGSTGIELTVFHLPPGDGHRPHQELQTLKDRVVAAGSRMHAEAGGPGLYVSVFFNDSTRLSKQSVTELGHALSNAILRSAVPTSLDQGPMQIPWSQLPEGIADITVHASVDGRDRLWSADAGGWVAPIQPHHIQAVLDAKAGTIPIARAKCTDLWLVVVNDVFGRGAPAELSEAAASHSYSSRFDRLFWLEAHTPSASELVNAG